MQTVKVFPKAWSSKQIYLDKMQAKKKLKVNHTKNSHVYTNMNLENLRFSLSPTGWVVGN